MTKDEIINKLIKATGVEIDYWLLESNRAAREREYGVKYEKIATRFKELRHHLLDAILALPEVHVKLTGSSESKKEGWENGCKRCGLRKPLWEGRTCLGPNDYKHKE